MCTLVNHTRFPKEDHLPDRACRDNKVTKGYRVEAALGLQRLYRVLPKQEEKYGKLR